MGEIVIMNDLEWPMLSHYVIYYEHLMKIMHRTEKEAYTQIHTYTHTHTHTHTQTHTHM